MRSFLVALLGLASASAPAVACPGNTACLSRTVVERTTDAVSGAGMVSRPVAAPARRLRLTLPGLVSAEPPPAASLLSFDPMPDAKPIVHDDQELFASASKKVDATMPAVRREAFTMTASPVIVAGTFDTVPGVGLSGQF